MMVSNRQSGTLHFDATYGWSHKIATFCTTQYLFKISMLIDESQLIN